MISDKSALYLRLMIATLSLLMSSAALSQERDDFPSCYGMLGADAPPSRQSGRVLYVLIDETATADDSLRRAVVEKALRYIRPGDKITVAKFASYIEDHYTQLPLKGQIDSPLEDEARYSISKRALTGFDTCMQRQQGFVKESVRKAILGSFNSNEDIPKTELLGSLASLSQLVKDDASTQKVVLVYSDMLENSDTTSFYESGHFRKIDPSLELDKVRDAGLVTDWGEASIYVIGAGSIDESSAYRSRKIMHPIQQFWTAYFDEGNAHLSGWGEPMLMTDLK